jgi:hypothetical protein
MTPTTEAQGWEKRLQCNGKYFSCREDLCDHVQRAITALRSQWKAELLEKVDKAANYMALMNSKEFHVAVTLTDLVRIIESS